MPATGTGSYPHSDHEQPAQTPQIARLRILLVGPELAADAMKLLLVQQEDMQCLSPLYSTDQVVSFLRRLRAPADVVLLVWHGLSEELHLLQSLRKLQQPCLVLTSLLFADERERIRHAGACGFLPMTATVAQLATAIRIVASGGTSFPDVSANIRGEEGNECNWDIAPRHLVFHRHRLEVLAQRSQWPLTEKDIPLFANLGSAISTKVLAEQVQRNHDRVRHDLSEHVYQFLEEVTDREVRSRLAAFQLLLELGILEYVPRY